MKKVIIYTDGGSAGNPGPSAIGIIFSNEKGEIIKKYSEAIGKATNNEAEYRAVIFALEKFKALFGKKLAESTEIELRSDSELMINQLGGKYKVLDPEIGGLFLKTWNLKTDFKKVTLKLISRNKNQEADKLVNEALEGQSKEQKLI